MPSDYRLVEVKLREAELLADLYSIVYDLDASAYLCAKAIEFGRPRTSDYFVVEGLVAAAVVRYCRCFTSGVRLRLSSKDLGELDDNDLAAHDYFIKLRDRFVAHSVNPFEETYVTTAVSERGGKKLPITSVSPGQHRVVLSDGDADTLGQLVQKVKTVIQKRVALEEQQLLAVIQGLPLDKVHSGDLHTPRPITPSDVAKSRKQAPRSNKVLKGTPRGKPPPCG